MLVRYRASSTNQLTAQEKKNTRVWEFEAKFLNYILSQAGKTYFVYKRKIGSVKLKNEEIIK